MPKNIFKTVVSILLVVFCLSSCGGSSAPPVSIPTPITGRATITGTVNAPTISGASINSKAVTEIPASEFTGTLYNLDGTTIGTCTTDSAGTCSIEGNISDIKPDDATSTEWTAKLILVAKNSAGTAQIETYVEANVAEGTTTEISLGTADSESTLAAQALRRKGGCAAWGDNCTTLFENFDPACYFKAQEQIWNDSTISGSGLADDGGKMIGLVKGAMASGFSPAAYGYDDWSGVINDALDGDLPSSILSSLASYAASATGVDTSVFADGYSGAVSAFSSLDTIIGTQLAGGAGISLLSSTGKAATIEEGSACDNIKDATIGADFLDGLIGTFMACSTPEECTNIYSDENCFKISIGLMEKFRVAESFEKIKEGGAAFQGFMSGMGAAECNGYFNADGTINSTNFSGLLHIFNRIDTEDQFDFDTMRKWGYSWEEVIRYATGGFENFLGEGDAFDPNKFEYYSEYFDNQVGTGEFDPWNIDWEHQEGTLESDWQGIGDPGLEFESCINLGYSFEECGGIIIQ